MQKVKNDKEVGIKTSIINDSHEHFAALLCYFILQNLNFKPQIWITLRMECQPRKPYIKIPRLKLERKKTN